jgi:DNA repair exonuclease SbcCD nuclease subunit
MERREMKIGVSGDWHTDNMGGTYLVNGTPNRELDIKKQIKFMAEKCKEKKVDLFVINGDIFSRTTTTGYYIAFVIDLIEEFTKRGIEVEILPGNHDISENGRGLMPALEKLNNKNIHITERAVIMKYNDVNIFFAPHERKENFKEFSSYTKYLLSKIKDKKVDVIIGHYQPKKAVPGSEEGMFAGSTRFVDTRKFKSYTQLINHVHKPQIIDDNIYLIGSPVRFNMNERKETKQFIIWDSEKNVVESIPLKCQKMSKISINLVKKNTYDLDSKKIKKYKGHMIGIYIETIKSNRPVISQTEIRNAFEKIGAHIIQFKIKTISTNKEIEKFSDKDMSPDSVFRRIILSDIKEEKTRKNVLKIGLRVLDELGEKEK